MPVVHNIDPHRNLDIGLKPELRKGWSNILILLRFLAAAMAFWHKLLLVRLAGLADLALDKAAAGNNLAAVHIALALDKAAGPDLARMTVDNIVVVAAGDNNSPALRDLAHQDYSPHLLAAPLTQSLIDRKYMGNHYCYRKPELEKQKMKEAEKIYACGHCHCKTWKNAFD
jgi:hypothetical protein